MDMPLLTSSATISLLETDCFEYKNSNNSFELSSIEISVVLNTRIPSLKECNSLFTTLLTVL